MPGKEKVSFAQLKVGVLGIVAMSCVALVVFLLTGDMQWFRKQIPLHLYTSDASGLNAGAPVRINGIGAGKVERVGLSGETDPRRVIKVDFLVDEDMMKQIPNDSIASISSDNLLGSTKFLQINKGESHELVSAGATVKSADTRQFDALVQQGYSVLDSLQSILGKVQDIVGQVEVGKGTIGKLLVDETLYQSLQATVNQVQLLSTTLNSKTGTIGHLVNDDALYQQLQGVITKVDNISQGLQQGQGSAGLFRRRSGVAAVRRHARADDLRSADQGRRGVGARAPGQAGCARPCPLLPAGGARASAPASRRHTDPDPDVGGVLSRPL